MNKTKSFSEARAERRPRGLSEAAEPNIMRSRPLKPGPATPEPAKHSAPVAVSRGRLRFLWPIVGIAVVGVIAMSLFPFRTKAPQYDCEVVKAYPHDARAFCQGLVIVDGSLYESTGQYGESSLRQVDLESGEPLALVNLDPRYFAEGLAAWDETLVQLTWKEKTGIVWDRATFREIGRFRYYGEGWGLTSDGRHLIQSDGSATLKFLDPKSFKQVKKLEVRDGKKRVTDLNELEYVEGEIYANIWHQDRIARISPRTGDVTGWIDLTNVIKACGKLDREAVANGIAYDAEAKRLFVTGKWWPKLFEIRLVEKSE
jgi:glutamine cyclotransferase